jgi:WD40 repeat protein
MNVWYAMTRIYDFSPDGQSALSGSGDETLRLWDVATGEPVRVFQGHRGQVYSVTFSPDGQYVLSGSRDGTLRLWPVSKEATMTWTCANRHVVELTDAQRAQYGLPDNLVLCPEE